MHHVYLLAGAIAAEIVATTSLKLSQGFTRPLPAVVTVVVANPFLSTSLASGSWNMDVSPQTTCTASAVGPVGAAITLTLGASGWRARFPSAWARMSTAR